MGRTDARVRYTQKVLKEALLQLLREKPVNRVTVRELCELAELNRATFYSHYRDCFDLLESIENELVAEFRKSLRLAQFSDASALIEAIYGIIERFPEACDVLIFRNPGSACLQRLIELARQESMAIWKAELPDAPEEELEMLYTHLSNGLLHVVVEGCGKYEKERLIDFVNRMVNGSLAQILRA